MTMITTMTTGTTMIRRYSELVQLPTFEERYNYLKLDGVVGEETFGFERWLNQVFYKTDTWRRLRDIVISRDNGCDLGMEGYDILGRIIVHHMNPITKEDILNRADIALNPEYLISTRKRTHDMIHFGNEEDTVYQPVVERRPNDTTLWRRS